MNKLIKFCRPEHNLVAGCGVIQLGTLSYFRELDPRFSMDQIADKNEGTESLTCDFVQGSTASRDALEELSPFIRLGSDGVVKNLVLSDMRGPNHFVWCCYRSPAGQSELNVVETGKRFNPEYEGCYEITDAADFAHRVATLLYRRPIEKLLDQGTSKRLAELTSEELGAIQIGFHHGDVHYAASKTLRISDGQLESYLNDIPAPFRPIFAKPSEYAWQREYRFVFWVQHPRLSILSVRHDPLLLPLLPIAPLE